MVYTDLDVDIRAHSKLVKVALNKLTETGEVSDGTDRGSTMKPVVDEVGEELEELVVILQGQFMSQVTKALALTDVVSSKLRNAVERCRGE